MVKAQRRGFVKTRKQNPVQEAPIKLNKKYMMWSIVAMIVMMMLSLSQTRKQASSILDVPKKREPPKFMGLEIPKEVLQRMHLAESQPDKFEILRDWAISEGITFEARKDGSYVAVRDGEELVLKEPDPELVNQSDYQDGDIDDEFISEQQQAEPFASQEHLQNNTENISD